MPTGKHPCDKDDDTKVIYMDKFSELLHEIRTCDLSTADLADLEKLVKKMKSRIEGKPSESQELPSVS